MKLYPESPGVGVGVDVVDPDTARGKGKEKTLLANADEPGAYDWLVKRNGPGGDESGGKASEENDPLVLALE